MSFKKRLFRFFLYLLLIFVLLGAVLVWGGASLIKHELKVFFEKKFEPNLEELDVTKSDNMLYKKVEEQGLRHIDPKAKNIPCQVKDCVFVAKLKHNMIEHYARMHSAKNLKCKFCDTLFSLYRDLKRHLKHHSIQLPCEKCGKIYRSLRTFNEHKKTPYTSKDKH